MKLTHPDAWNMYAGGTFAAADRHSYDVYTSLGQYIIQPISNKRNSNQHIGYNVHFCNTEGRLTGGLWQPLSRHLVTLPQARKLCQDHFAQHGTNESIYALKTS
jgi:hypothetical protein